MTFSQPEIGFDQADVVIGGTAKPTTVVVQELEPFIGANNQVAVSGISRFGTVTATLPAGMAQYGSLEQSAASTSIDNEVTFTILVGAGRWSLYD